MRNDLIVFEFSHPDRSVEVLLPPYIVSSLAMHVELILNGWLRLERSPFAIELQLAALERGSIKIGFLPRWGKKVGTAFTPENISAANDLTETLDRIVKWFFQGGLALGLFAIADDGVTALNRTAASNEKLAAVQLETLRRDEQLMAHYEQLSRDIRATPAPTCTVMAPEAPTVIVIENRRDIGLIGSRAPQLDRKNEAFEGRITKLDGPFSLRRREDRASVDVYTAELLLKDGPALVLVDWQSQAEPPVGTKEQLLVSGTFSPNLVGDWVSDDDIPEELLKVRARLNVHLLFEGR